MNYTLPLWIKNIDNSLEYDSTYVIHGNEIRDNSILPVELLRDSELKYSEIEYKSFTDSLFHILRLKGFDAVISYEINHGYTAIPLKDGLTDDQIVRDIEPFVGNIFSNNADTNTPKEYFNKLGDLIELLNSDKLAEKLNFALLVDFFSESDPNDRLMDAHPNLEEAFLSSYQHAKDKVVPFIHQDRNSNDVLSKHPVFWVVKNTSSLPPFLLSGIGIRHVAIAEPGLEERAIAAGVSISRFIDYDNLDDETKKLWDRLFEKIAKSMSGLTLRNVDEIINSRRGELLAANGEKECEKWTNGIIDVAKEYRVGLTENPWGSDIVKERISRAEEELKVYVKGQDYAIDKSANLLKMAALNLTQVDSKDGGTAPRGCLFFAGPTGVGKTELSKSIAKLVFGSEDEMIRFDMSEFNQGHSDARLVGSPPGYRGHEQGGELTNAIKKKPFSVVLFDEIEKANPVIFDKFLQILSDGRLTDGRGDTVYFTESIIIFTSNIGVADMQDWIQKNPSVSEAEYQKEYKRHVERFFRDQVGRPEIYGRIDEDNIIVFNSITKETAEKIAGMAIDTIVENIRNLQQVDVQISEEARRQIIDIATDEKVLEYGGRGVKNAIKRTLTAGITTPMLKLRSDDEQIVKIVKIDNNGNLICE